MKGDSDGSCQRGRPRKGSVAVTMHRDRNEVRELAMQRAGKGRPKQEKKRGKGPEAEASLEG